MFNFLKSLSWILLIAISFSSFGQQTDKYELTYFNGKRDIIKVKAQLRLEDSQLYMSQNGSKSADFPKYVKNLIVSDKKGEPIQIQFQDSVKWILEGVFPGQMVNVEYELHVKHEDQEWPGGIDGVAYIRDFGVMTTGRSLFVMNGEKKENIKVHAEIPEGVKISTSWNDEPGKENSFEVSDLDNLQEAFLFAGKQEEVLIKRESFNFLMLTLTTKCDCTRNF